MAAPHPDFVSLSEICPTILIEASYGTSANFTGEVVRGYKARKAMLSLAAAEGICRAQQEALSMGLSLKIFDAYRPVKAVTFFQEWAMRPETNLERKRLFYPIFERKELFERGYIAKRSSHSRGGAVDLTLALVSTGKELEMGTAFDFFDSLSNTDSPLISAEQKKNRQLLKRLMVGAGFKNFDQEWWHYSFTSEQFPDQYFDFDIE